MMQLSKLGLTLVVAVLAACALNPRVYSSQKPQVDFTAYRTYSYVGDLGTDEAGQPRRLLTQYLIAAVDREMQARGYRYVPEGGDLLVNFYVQTQEKIQSRPAAPAGPYMGFGYFYYRRGLYMGWRAYPEAEISQFTEGTLNIDIVDAAERELVWEGVAIGRVTEEARRDVQGAIDRVVPQVFEDFPGRAGR